MEKTVIIASRNPVKLDAVRQGFIRMFPHEVFDFKWISTDSWVSDQPMSDKETYSWAYNRVQDAQKNNPEAKYWVGIEWGVEKTNDSLESFAWIVVLKDTGETSHSKTATLSLPKKLKVLIDEWKELWEASDIVFWEKHSKCKTGTTWLLTWDLITRCEYCAHSVILALVPFKNQELYGGTTLF